MLNVEGKYTAFLAQTNSSSNCIQINRLSITVTVFNYLNHTKRVFRRI
jgi:hypothetical protein